MRAPNLRVARREQRYLRLPATASGRYDYKAPAFEYRAVLAYDEHGLVVAYPESPSASPNGALVAGSRVRDRVVSGARTRFNVAQVRIVAILGAAVARTGCIVMNPAST